MYSPRPPAPIAAAIVTVPTPTTAETRMPATIAGKRQRQLHLPQPLHRRHPHRIRGLEDRRVDRAKAGGGRADDRQQRVQDQRDKRGAGADAADERQRQEEAEEREAGDRLHDARDGGQRAADARPPRGDDAERHADRHSRGRRHEHQRNVLPEELPELRGVRAPELKQASQDVDQHLDDRM